MIYKIFGPIGIDPDSAKEQERAAAYVECDLAFDSFLLASNLAIASVDLTLRLVADALQTDASSEIQAKAQTELFNLRAVVHAAHKRGSALSDAVRTAADLGRHIQNRA